MEKKETTTVKEKIKFVPKFKVIYKSFKELNEAFKQKHL